MLHEQYTGFHQKIKSIYVNLRNFSLISGTDREVDHINPYFFPILKNKFISRVGLLHSGGLIHMRFSNYLLTFNLLLKKIVCGSCWVYGKLLKYMYLVILNGRTSIISWLSPIKTAS